MNRRPNFPNGHAGPPPHILPNLLGAAPIGPQQLQAQAVAVVNPVTAILNDTQLLMMVAASCPGTPTEAVDRAVDIVGEVIESGQHKLQARLVAYQQAQAEKARAEKARAAAGG